MPELSIIVPVYKVEKYLPKCIDSILAQTFRDFELILIDDGSPDNCGAICDEYAAWDSRIKVIHQVNAGVSAARNAGLDIASGTYLGFVDSDDWIEPEMYETMIATAIEKQVDVVACGIKHFSERGELLFEELLSEQAYTSEQLCASIYGMPNHIGGCIWNKIVRRHPVQDVRYRVGIAMAEDRLYLCDYFCFCNGAFKIGNALYCVLERSDSATHKQDASVPYEMITSSYLLMKLAQKRPYLETPATDKFLDDCVRNLPRIRKAGQATKQRYFPMMAKGYWLMFKVLMRSSVKKVLPGNKLRGYAYEMIKIVRGRA